MTIVALKKSDGPAANADTRIRLSCDESGGWILSRQDNSRRRFPDFEAAVDGARHAPDAKTATIEVWQGGEYICCLPPKEWPDRGGSTGGTSAAAPESRFFAAAERYANRAARLLMTAAGPVFWLALMVLAMAASLGWRLLLL